MYHSSSLLIKDSIKEELSKKSLMETMLLQTALVKEFFVAKTIRLRSGEVIVNDNQKLESILNLNLMHNNSKLNFKFFHSMLS